jgi:hypothetical protein
MVIYAVLGPFKEDRVTLRAQASSTTSPERRATRHKLFLPSAAADQAQARVMAEIAARGLERNAWQLDALGYMVLTPEQTGARLGPRSVRTEGPGLTPSSATASTLMATSDRWRRDADRALLIPLPLLHDPMYEHADEPRHARPGSALVARAHPRSMSRRCAGRPKR